MKLRIKNLELRVLGIVVVYAVLFLWLFDRHFAPRGVWSVEIRAPRTQTRLVKGPVPDYRVDVDDTQDVWRLKETPVYFAVDAPRKFDQAEIAVEFRGDVPIIFGGVVKRLDPWVVEQRVLYHKYLEELAWPRVEEEGYILWQREARYGSVKEFMDNPPAVEEVATVDVSQAMKTLKHENIKALGFRYDVSLRGPQDIYLYTADEDIEVKFLFHDVNRHDGKDVVDVQLSQAGEVIKRETLEDDGIEWGTGEASSPREFTIYHTPPQPGVYRLTVRTTDDIFIRRVETSPGKMVWKNTLYLGDEVGYREGSARPVTVYSNGQGYAVRTPHPEGVQKVEFTEAQPLGLMSQGLSLELAEHNKQYTIQMPREIAGKVLAIRVPKRDAVLTTEGFFALSQEAFFLPEPISYMSDLDLDRLGINYVLASYKFAKNRGRDLKNNSVRVSTFDINPISPLQFFVSAPQGMAGDFELKEIRFKLQKPRLTPARIFGKIRKLWAKPR
ncbi:hypothetical protein HY477_02185 [Candidatus Uhrbacteria bacterium]|nr:hypothetical protein [Candidatus Uhrbacteria bacterium]